MTADQYKEILSKVKFNRPEMLFHSEDSKGIEYYSTNCEIDYVVFDEDMFNENFDSFTHGSNMTNLSRCSRIKRVNSDCQTDRRVTKKRKNISL
jgi:hypothetical protein